MTPESGAETVTRYVWGLDLSQSVQGAGGIGGLLLQDTGTATRLYTYEANGNVGQLVDGTTGAVVAHYEYDPFGTTLTASGTAAAANPFRFSTKYTDDETTLVYYGYRFYSPTLGRWLTRDPLGEDGGINLYAMLENNLIDFIDFLGLDVVTWKKDGYVYICGKKDAGVTDFFTMEKPTKAKLAERLGLTVQELNSFKQNSELASLDEHKVVPAGSKLWVVLLPEGDKQLLARLSYSEGTSDSMDDKYAVASVILNRIAHKKKYPKVSPYKKTIHEVIYQKNQFEALFNGKKWTNSVTPAELPLINDILEWNISVGAAVKAIEMGPMPELNGATIFHSTKKYGEKKEIIPGQVAKKYWTVKYVVNIGKHYYFTITPKGRS